MVPEPSILSTKKNEQDMAQLCVDLCLAIDTKDFLWESVYPNFESTQKQALFFEALLPSLLKGQISSMPPSTMKVRFSAGAILHLWHAKMMEVISLIRGIILYFSATFHAKSQNRCFGS